MPKTIFKANVQIPEYPTVRFMRKEPAGNQPAFTDVTLQVASVEIEKIGATDSHSLIRLDDKGEIVWRTIHHSLDEARWQARHEYGIEEKDWMTG